MIDIIFYILVVLAIIQGWRKGFILAVFSLVCYLLGLAAAVKLSAVLASRLSSDWQVSGRWLPVLAFVIVFLTVVILVRLLAKMIEKLVGLAMLGWLNKLGGMVFFLILYISVYSVFLFYATRIPVISAEATGASRLYPLISPWGPGIIHFMGKCIPFGQDMFAVLEAFFDRIGHRIN